MIKKILLFGPKVNSDVEGAYGGGTGGYTRKMALYLNNFKSIYYKQIPCFHTIRGEQIPFGFVGRFLTDLSRLMKGIATQKPSIIHFLGQYRAALPREFVSSLLALAKGIPYLYEIKAGVFVKWYKSTNIFNQWMMRFILKNASGLLGQGMPYVKFVEQELGLSITYYPNFVATPELRSTPEKELFTTHPKILFVGYAFQAKGVFELVEACNEVASIYPLELTMIGKEHKDFKDWIGQLNLHKDFTLNRLGKQPHDNVLKSFHMNDIYCYPTRHSGEGHNNTINEALMSSMVIITTKQGFLESIIGKDRGYLLEEVTVNDLAKVLIHILENKEEAVQKAKNGRIHLEKHFIDTVAFQKLERIYQAIA